MEKLDWIITAIDSALDSKKKRHIAGGILMSVSLLFGGLAFTVVTWRTEDNIDEQRLIE